MNLKLAEARFAALPIIPALLGMSAQVQKNTVNLVRMRQELGSLEDCIKYPLYSINTQTAQGRRIPEQAWEMRKNFAAGKGVA